MRTRFCIENIPELVDDIQCNDSDWQTSLTRLAHFSRDGVPGANAALQETASGHVLHQLNLLDVSLEKYCDFEMVEKVVEQLKFLQEQGVRAAKPGLRACFSRHSDRLKTEAISGDAHSLQSLEKLAKTYPEAQVALACYKRRNLEKVGVGYTRSTSSSISGFIDYYRCKPVITLLEKASKQDCPQAHFELGRCYETGFGKPQALEEAFYYFYLAAKQGVEDAKTKLEAHLKTHDPERLCLAYLYLGLLQAQPMHALTSAYAHAPSQYQATVDLLEEKKVLSVVKHLYLLNAAIQASQVKESKPHVWENRLNEHLFKLMRGKTVKQVESLLKNVRQVFLPAQIVKLAFAFNERFTEFTEIQRIAWLILAEKVTQYGPEKSDQVAAALANMSVEVQARWRAKLTQDEDLTAPTEASEVSAHSSSSETAEGLDPTSTTVPSEAVQTIPTPPPLPPVRPGTAKQLSKSTPVFSPARDPEDSRIAQLNNLPTAPSDALPPTAAIGQPYESPTPAT